MSKKFSRIDILNLDVQTFKGIQKDLIRLLSGRSAESLCKGIINLGNSIDFFSEIN